MSLDISLDEITARLRQGQFANEQAVSQGVVLRVLQELGWNTWDTDVVWPEYQTGEGRADFAICHPPRKPLIFVEVKQPGRAEDAVRQALEYAFHVGVPFVVLTDGRTWSFYLPGEQGSYDDRRVYKLDLFERSASEAAQALERYLNRARVVDGNAINTARDEYRNRARRSQARGAIPEAWRELAEKGDELLVELISSAVESKSGIRPDDDDVAEFLAGLVPPARVEPSVGKSTANARVSGSQGASIQQDSRVPAAEGRAAGTAKVLEKSQWCRNAKEVMVFVLRELAARDQTFCQRLAAHPNAQGRKRRYIAQEPADLYPDRLDLKEYSEKIGNGWYVATNLNNVSKRALVRTAVEVAGLRFGTDVQIPF